jgi:RNA polymerase sigma factor (sigma-70 family)
MRSPEQVLDELLVLRCQAGEGAALDELSRRWHRRVLGQAFRLTGRAEAAPEVAQEAWLAIVRGIRRLRDPSGFPAWTYRIVARKAADWIRRQQRRRRLETRVANDPPPTASGPLGSRADAIGSLRAALRELPEGRRVVLTMFYLEELSVREIAELLAVPSGTVKSRLYHARNDLRRKMEEEP